MDIKKTTAAFLSLMAAANIGFAAPTSYPSSGETQAVKPAEDFQRMLNNNYVYLYNDGNTTYYLDLKSIFIKTDTDAYKEWNENIVTIDNATQKQTGTFPQYNSYDVKAQTGYNKIWSENKQQWVNADVYYLGKDSGCIANKAYMLGFIEAFEGGL